VQAISILAPPLIAIDPMDAQVFGHLASVSRLKF
jgi:hypothetical protein